MKRAQVAIEFLTTYGWMFLVIGAVFGVMVYFGLGNVRDSVPIRCDFGFEFGCGVTYALENGTFLAQIKNTGTESLYINRTICSFSTYEERIQTTYSPAIGLGVGGETVLYCDPDDLSETPVLTGRQLFGIKVIYEINESGALPNIASGEMVIEVVEGDLPTAYAGTYTTGTTSVLLP